jgi:BMFP domain-containing protein YqiC
MPQQSSFPQALLDDLSKLATNAAGVAQGARQEFEGMLSAKIDGWLADRNLVTREEFEAVAEMARLAREENALLKDRITALESTYSRTE